MLLVHGWTDVVRPEDHGIYNRDIQEEGKNVLVIFPALPSDVVAASQLIVEINPTHALLVVQGNAEGTLNNDPLSVFLPPLNCGKLSPVRECAGYIHHSVIFPRCCYNVPTLSES